MRKGKAKEEGGKGRWGKMKVGKGKGKGGKTKGCEGEREKMKGANDFTFFEKPNSNSSPLPICNYSH
jgi:hypothetical protein